MKPGVAERENWGLTLPNQFRTRGANDRAAANHCMRANGRASILSSGVYHVANQWAGPARSDDPFQQSRLGIHVARRACRAIRVFWHRLLGDDRFIDVE